MAKKLTLLDGATGSGLWEKTENKIPVWRYNIENPAIVVELAKEYIEAGSEIIQANTFCANRQSVKNVDYTLEAVIREAIKLARAAAEGTNVKVAMNAGPLTSLLKPFGDLSSEECAEIYREQLSFGMLEKPDYLILETFLDIEMMKIAATEAKKFDVPVLCSMSFTKFGKTMMGNSVKKVCDELKPLGVDAVGLNCSVGPEVTLPIARAFADYTDLPVFYKPNAGLPTEEGSEFDIETFVKDILPAAEFVSYLGGCCGTNPAYIKRLNERLKEADK